jgi:hypothetical protein
MATIQRCFDSQNDRRNTDNNHNSRNIDAAIVQALQDELEPILLHPTSTSSSSILENDEMMKCMMDPSTVEKDHYEPQSKKKQRSGTTSNAESDLQQQQQHNVLTYVANMYRLVQKATTVYQLLDTSNKGCVVAEDLYRAMNELNTTTTATTTSSNKKDESTVSYETVITMMTEFQQSIVTETASEDECILTLEDIIHIAKLVNL